MLLLGFHASVFVAVVLPCSYDSTAARARTRPSGSTRVQISPSTATSDRDSNADKRPRSDGADETSKSTRKPLEVTHGEADAVLAPPRKSLVAKAASRGGKPPALPARAVRDPSMEHSREGSASNSPDARTASNGSDSESRNDRTECIRGGEASGSSRVSPGSNTNGSKARDNSPQKSSGVSASTPSGTRTALNSISKPRDDRTRHSPGDSASSSSDARAASNSSGKSRGDRDIGAEKGGRAVGPPPNSRAGNDPVKADRGGRALHSDQNAGSTTAQVTETVSREASVKVNYISIVSMGCLFPALYSTNRSIPVVAQEVTLLFLCLPSDNV